MSFEFTILLVSSKCDLKSRYNTKLRPLLSKFWIWSSNFSLNCLRLNIKLQYIRSKFYYTFKLDYQFRFSFIFRWTFPYLLPFHFIFLNASAWNTMALSIERYLLIKHNKTSNNFLYYILPILFVAIALNIPRFFEYDWLIEEDGTRLLQGTDMRKSYHYRLYYLNVANLIISGIIPMTTIIVLNFTLAHLLVQKQRIWREMTGVAKRDFQITKVLIILALVFVICHSFRFGLSFYELVIHIYVSILVYHHIKVNSRLNVFEGCHQID